VAAQARLATELVALPLATLPWRWVTRAGGPDVPFDPAAGPVFAIPANSKAGFVTLDSGSR
jgi:hypothetical protein